MTSPWTLIDGRRVLLASLGAEERARFGLPPPEPARQEALGALAADQADFWRRHDISQADITPDQRETSNLKVWEDTLARAARLTWLSDDEIQRRLRSVNIYGFVSFDSERKRAPNPDPLTVMLASIEKSLAGAELLAGIEAIYAIARETALEIEDFEESLAALERLEERMAETRAFFDAPNEPLARFDARLCEVTRSGGPR
jgi:hypothetical protein